MRAQLRTYHAIPSLQAHQDASAYKQLQDAPRLKSILKGAAEDLPEPRDLAEFKAKDPPRTNPVNLIFLICSQASHVAELHFPGDGEFHDLIMKTRYTSRSRANAFLWLMWFYLESDFTEEGCEENPFGAGVDYGKEVANQGIPVLEEMTAEEEERENNDPQEEIDFGREKQNHRAKIIAADHAYMAEHQSKRGPRGKLAAEDSPSAAILPRIRPSKHESDIDSTRSTPPPRALGRIAAGSTGRRGGGSLKYQIVDGSSPAAATTPHVIDGIVPRKPRPPTAHQLAVERNRNQRVEYILDRGLRRQHRRARKVRRQEGSLIRAKRRLDATVDQFADSDDEEYKMFASDKAPLGFRDRGFGGLCQLSTEDDDFGEEFSAYAASLRRANRRLVRWTGRTDLAVVAPTKSRTATHPSDDKTPEPQLELVGKPHKNSKGSLKSKINGNANGDVVMEDADDLDDVDKELLGMASGGEDEELDDVDKTLLGMDDGSDGSDA
jgi:Ino eighty subunit 1